MKKQYVKLFEEFSQFSDRESTETAIPTTSQNKIVYCLQVRSIDTKEDYDLGDFVTDDYYCVDKSRLEKIQSKLEQDNTNMKASRKESRENYGKYLLTRSRIIEIPISYGQSLITKVIGHDNGRIYSSNKTINGIDFNSSDIEIAKGIKNSFKKETESWSWLNFWGWFYDTITNGQVFIRDLVGSDLSIYPGRPVYDPNSETTTHVSFSIENDDPAVSSVDDIYIERNPRTTVTVTK